MAQKRPRFSVGVMAMCCGFLSLTVVAREASPASSAPLPETSADAPRKYALMHQQLMHPGASASASAMPAVTTPLSPTLSQIVESKRHRKTRETFPPSRPASTGEELGTVDQGAPERATRRRRMEPKGGGFPASRLVFVPSRGRRYGGFGMPAEKRQITIEQMLEKGDYFVPNRGKKAPVSSGGGGGAGGELMIKKGQFDVLLGPGSPDEYFFPNRGKKEYFLAYDPATGRGSSPFEGKLAAAAGFGGDGRHPVESRLRRNLLDNLASERKDTFFSSRGKRIRPATDGMVLWPAEPLQGVEQEALAADDGATGPEDFSGQREDIETTLLWNDALLPLFPMERPSS